MLRRERSRGERLRGGILSVLLVSGLLLPAISQSIVPEKTTFQGLLLDFAGAPVNGMVDFSFAMFSTRLDGVAFWAEAHPAVPVVDGAYRVSLGAVTPLTSDLVSGGFIYLEIVADGVILSPRTRILSVPFAIQASSAAEVVDGSVTVSKIGEACALNEVLIKAASGWACGVATGPPGPVGPAGSIGPTGPAPVSTSAVCTNSHTTSLGISFVCSQVCGGSERVVGGIFAHSTFTAGTGVSAGTCRAVASATPACTAVSDAGSLITRGSCCVCTP